MSQQVAKKSYKSTLNLPKSKFAMKANLVQNEPATLARWNHRGLYDQIRQARSGRPKYVFHDGPPYANGPIHLGHLLNKVLKDFVVRSKTMAGFDCPYVPGWDCHGLPIEHKVMQQLGERARAMAPMQIRKRCQDYAKKYVSLQAVQMQRLLTLADYDDPYLTMDPAYEAATLEVFAELVRQGLVYRALKPVHWSIANQTALAEAELEYEDRQDKSVYVLFEIKDVSQLPASLRAPGHEPIHLMIWTTTPWTLPANLAVAVHDRYEYGLYSLEHAGKSTWAILATELGPKVLELGGSKPNEPLGTANGIDLKSIHYKHPFLDRICPVVAASYVTFEDGTGLVHTAPGHGYEDYMTGIQEGLEIYCPVQNDGTFDDTAPPWLQGVDVWHANDLIIQQLRQSGHLYYDHQFTHSYPHDWRSKTPVIFRATEQWFIGVDAPMAQSRNQSEPDPRPRNEIPNQSTTNTLRNAALRATEQIHFIPDWGCNRMRGMLKSRPDWCLSRQRAWGLPIPAFFDPSSQQWILTSASVKAVAAKFREHGANYWFSADPPALLEAYDPKSDPDAPAWALDTPVESLKKSDDIFDVWFESGSSWNAVIRQRFGERVYPTDLYLEGSDQHRGWFQLSLLAALGATGQSPFRNVLTHGFMVDKDGRKMSKSDGNALEVEVLIKQFGADVCRWWVSSLNTDNDVKVDLEFFKLAGEEYRKVRNTIRFLVGNLFDFNPDQDDYTFTIEDRCSLDAWALGELDKLIATVSTSYDKLHFRGGSESIFHFCNDTMSAVYLAAVKDRLYCDPADSPRRRRCQSTLFRIADSMIRLIAPLLSHTAEEAWTALHGTDVESVHLQLLPKTANEQVDDDWDQVFRHRSRWLKLIEDTRQQLDLDNPLDCGLIVPTDDSLAKFNPVDLADLCGISRLEFTKIDTAQVVDLREEPRCERSWKHDSTVKLRGDGGMLSDRDAQAIGL